MEMKERNKSKNDALVPNLGVRVGSGASDRERRAAPRERATTMDWVRLRCLRDIQVEMTDPQLDTWICHCGDRPRLEHTSDQQPSSGC